MIGVSICSGVGGLDLGFERAGIKTVLQVEKDLECKKVLIDKFGCPIASDLKTLRYENGEFKDDEKTYYKGRPGIIYGGIPCQPYSVAGNQKAFEDNRDLWPDAFRIIKQSRPAWVVIENVANFKNLGFTRTKVDLEGEGYTLRPFIIPACAVGAQHRRDRIFIIAHNNSEPLREKQECKQKSKDKTQPREFGENESATNTNSQGQQRKATTSTKKNNKGKWEDNWWAATAASFGNWFKVKP